jgi:twinkle protein
VSLPFKDANECLVEGVSVEEMAQALVNAANLDPEGLRRAGDFADDVVRLFWPEQGHHRWLQRSLRQGWRQADVPARRGHTVDRRQRAGKSQILSDCMVHWIDEGSRICLSSLEMKPAQTLKRMVKQAGNVDRPTEGLSAHPRRSWIKGCCSTKRSARPASKGLLQIFDYARAKYGCDQFVIDSLMRLGIAGDDYNGQEKAMFLLIDWASRTTCTCIWSPTPQRRKGRRRSRDRGHQGRNGDRRQRLQHERRAAHIEGLKEALEIVERKCLTQEISGVANTIRARISDLEKS